MSAADDLLARIRDYCDQTRTSRSGFGIAVSKDKNLIRRLEEGRVTIRTYDRIVQFLDRAPSSLQSKLRDAP